jgi:hypothetical protein
MGCAGCAEGAEDGIWDMGTKPLGSGAVDPATAGPRKGRHRLPGGKCRQMGYGNQAARKRRKRRLGRRLNHSRPRDCGGQEVLSPAGRGMSDPGGSADNRRAKRTPEWWHCPPGGGCHQIVVGAESTQARGAMKAETFGGPISNHLLARLWRWSLSSMMRGNSIVILGASEVVLK